MKVRELIKVLETANQNQSVFIEAVDDNGDMEVTESLTVDVNEEEEVIIYHV